MPVFGDYETVGEPVATRDERGHVSTVWQARKSGARGGPLYAIKCYAPHRREPKDGQPEDALDEDRVLEFLEGIKQLKKAHSEGGCYFVPIHAFGMTDTGAWYVTDFYPRNTLKAWIARQGADRAEKLGVDFIKQAWIPRRGGVDSAAAVRHVVYSVVNGCLALKRSRGYSHGNLKSGNVFLAGKPRPLRHTPLHLADPYPAAPSQLSRLEGDKQDEPGELHDKAIEAHDLRAVGELILELVEGPLIQSGGDYDYPILPSLAWGRLGKDGTHWRLLCNRLLDPQLSPDKISLESLAKEFHPKPVNIPMILIGFGGICLLAVGGFYGTKLVVKGNAEREAERERQFEVATNAVWTAYRAGNFTDAIAEAGKALAIHKDDARMKQLKADARERQAERERQFGVARNAVWTAYRAGKFTDAITEADKALAIHSDDAGMKQLKADALARQSAAAQETERERQFGAATNGAWAAYRADNLTNAIAEVDKALAIHGDDAGIRKLKAEVEAKKKAATLEAERERQFEVATNAAWAAYRADKFTNAIAQADKALAIHRDDTGIRKLKAEVEAKQSAAAQQAERERQFGAATNAAWMAYRADKFTNAIAETDKALAIHGDDAGMKQLKADALARFTLAKGYEPQPDTPPPTNNVSGQKRPELAKLDTTLETYEVLFRLKSPAPNIVDKNGTQLKPLPLTLIPLDQKAAILRLLKELESGYQAGGWLQERERRLQNLRGKVKDW